MLAGEARAAFLGAALKAIACTPNLNRDATAAEYDRLVVGPARQIRALALAPADQPLSDAEIEETLERLTGILRAKRVPDEERAERVHDVLSHSGGGSA